MQNQGDALATITAAWKAIQGGRAPEARSLLEAALPLLVARIAGGDTFSGLVTLQATAMSLQAGDEKLARQYAQLVVGETASLLEERGTAARSALQARNSRAADAPLRYAYLVALALVPFAPRQPRVIPSLVPGDPPAEPFLGALNAQRFLDAAGWASWDYPADAAQKARRWSAFTFTKIGGSLLGNSEDGRAIEDAQHLADAALVLLAGSEPDQLLADALNLKGRVFVRYGISHYADAIPLFERAVEIERADNENAAAIDLQNVGAVYVELASFQRVRGQTEAAAVSEAAAEKTLADAIATFRARDPEHRLAAALNNLAALHIGRGRWQEANDLLVEAWDLVSRGAEDRVQVATTFGALFIAQKKWEKAVPLLRVAVDALPSTGGDFEKNIQANGNLGLALLFAGDPAAAEPYLSRAIDGLDSMRRSFLSARAAMSTSKTLLWIYEAWIACLSRLGENDPERRAAAFAASERIKWATFTEFLRFQPLRLQHDGDPLIEEEQQLLDMLWPTISAPPAKAVRTPQVDATLQRLEAIWDELAPRYPAHVAIRRGQTVSAAEAAALLDDDVAVLVEYFLGPDHGTALAFVLQRGDAAPRIVALPATADDVHALVTELHGYNFQTPVATWDDALHRLHDAVLAPILPFISEGAGVCVIPYGPLHNVPFGALHDGTRHALVRNAFVVAQSASALRWWVGKDRAEHARCLIFAATHPSVAGGLSFGDLSLFEKLAAGEIAPLFDEAKLVTGGDATTAALLGELAPSTSPWHIAHIACHGLFKPDGLESFLVLAPDAQGANTLSALDIAVNVRADTTLVTLSACETGLAETTTGDEVAGLAQAFLLAGASTVLASLWLVQVGAGVALTRRFYELWLKGAAGSAVTKLRALQAAQRYLLDGAQSDFGHTLSHPYQWAAFQLYGDWK